MTHRSGLIFKGPISCMFLVIAGCSGGGSSGVLTGAQGGGSSGGAAQGGQSSGNSSGASQGAQGGVNSTGSGGSTNASGGSGLTGGQTASTNGGSAQAGGQSTAASGGDAGRSGSGGTPAGGSSGKGGGTASGGLAGAASGGAGTMAGGQSGENGGQAGRGGGAGQTGTAGASGGAENPCVGKAWPSADPTNAGPFEVTSEKNVGPLAGALPDPVYGNEQQRFNIYRPKDLAQSGYCHPVLVWANGHGDNPEQNPPKCIVNSATNTWCGTYPMLINQLASHGFVVIASLSTTTSQGNPLPTIAGLNWLLQQAEDPMSPYYHRLDTAHIGALGHSEGGMSTCKAAADPRIKAIATVSGTTSLSGLHGPALFFCGEKDEVAKCSGINTVFKSVKDQPSIFINNLTADHGSWLGQNGIKGPTIFGLTAWFRIHLMGDTENRKRFYGQNCTFCTDNRVKVEQNSLMTQ
ncbi:MAG TPA: hypothetical protein VFQ61_24600 [Polyangiaceae bacterium]|nr:hypothetical protein [Polyangiaceae bacterium]